MKFLLWRLGFTQGGWRDLCSEQADLAHKERKALQAALKATGSAAGHAGRGTWASLYPGCLQQQTSQLPWGTQGNHQAVSTGPSHLPSASLPWRTCSVDSITSSSTTNYIELQKYKSHDLLMCSPVEFILLFYFSIMHQRGLWLSTDAINDFGVLHRWPAGGNHLVICGHTCLSHHTTGLRVVNPEWEVIRHTGCYPDKDSWKMQAASRQCSLPVDWKYIVLTMNAVVGQTAFVLATEQEFNETVKSECESVEGEKTEQMQRSKSAPTLPCCSLPHAETLLLIYSTKQAPCLSLRLKK